MHFNLNLYHLLFCPYLQLSEPEKNKEVDKSVAKKEEKREDMSKPKGTIDDDDDDDDEEMVSLGYPKIQKFNVLVLTVDN